MILIITKRKFDTSVEDVIDWIWYLGGEFTRINGDDVYGNLSKLKIEIGQESTIESINIAKKIGESIYNAVFFRRWSDREHLDKIAENRISNFEYKSIQTVLSNDDFTVRQILFKKIKANYWLPEAEKISVNKLDVLLKASSIGLKIPNTLVCTDKTSLLSFKDRFKRIITKDLSISHFFGTKKYGKQTYTTEIKNDNIDEIPETFLPSLFQELIEKKYEIRSVYLEGSFYSMAIFSQSDKQTEIDFRNYNLEKPNRTVPYKIPQEVECKLDSLMKGLGLNTGSIDLIKTSDNQYVFLEVNPVGQFGMTSYPCNYKIEKKIAQLLMLKNR